MFNRWSQVFCNLSFYLTIKKTLFQVLENTFLLVSIFGSIIYSWFKFLETKSGSKYLSYWLFFIGFCLFVLIPCLSADICRHLKFSTPFNGYALHDHVIKNISLSLGMRASCRGRCTIESKCVSINIGPPINDKVLCQLSDSDHIRHPEDLQPLEGFMYRGTEVRNSKSIKGVLVFLFVPRLLVARVVKKALFCILFLLN